MVGMISRRFAIAAAFAAVLLAALGVFRADALAPVIDLSAGGADVSILGTDAYDSLGNASAVGDVNGDGSGDLIVSSTGGDGPGTGMICNSTVPGDRCEAGEVYVIYSAGTRLSDLDLDSTSADVTIYGSQAQERLGWSLASGDVNGDGIDDIIVGAPGTSNGKAYVVYGSASLPSTIDIGTGGAGVTMSGPSSFFGDNLGAAVSSGDINGDGTDEIVVAEPSLQSVYVMYGGPALPPAINFANGDEDLLIKNGDNELGSALASGDVNADTIDDLVIGGPHAGRVFVIYGATTLPATIDLLTTSNTGIADVTVDSRRSLGTSLALADVNGDAVNDIVMGEPNGAASNVSGTCFDPPNECYVGRTYVIYGGNALPSTVDLDITVADVTIYGANSGDVTGGTLAAGDFTNDGFADIAIGRTPVEPGVGSGLNDMYVVDGSASLPATIELGSSPDTTISNTSKVLPIGAGEISGDDVNDLILGSTIQDTPSGPLGGRAFIIRGDSPMLPYPGDTDGDGCPDLKEAGPNVLAGGRRSYTNPNDYFNPSHDGQNRVDDILLVVQAYFKDDNDGNPGLPPYTIGYNPDTDRTLVGPDAWNLGPPDGQQRVDDILNSIHQYFHDCA